MKKSLLFSLSSQNKKDLSCCIRIYPICFENNIAIVIKMDSQYEGTVGIKIHEV